ncbi:Major Facilitator Superfamily protein [Nocardioides terrae]|uniref:Major Facilitator Superfamily protein n=1 Tax=Nocardioides terrae TaxID=574651 RepID=A0A1I1L9U2_9ACTN|nr:MFS transporter [Nocardioides terrae]SFC66310.1 Major Facilitator Superfamily protein [Nocardioides terrae]
MASRGRYPLAVGIALLGLGPYVVLSTALVPVRHAVASSIGTSQETLGLATGLGSAAYAVGAVLTAQLALLVVQRRLFVTAESVFVAASLAAALAPSGTVLVPALVLQGLAAGAMLVSSLPPLITRFGAGRVALSAAIVNVGIFGASTFGPIVGGLVAGGEHWRWLFAGATVLAAAGLVVAAVGYERWDPLEPEARVDGPALGLVVVTTVTGFIAASLVSGHGIGARPVIVLAVVALAALVLLLVWEMRRPDPLIPVSALSTQLPVTGILVAMAGGAVVVTATDLVQTRLSTVEGRSAADVAATFWPMPVGALVGAVAFWALFRTRFVPVLVDVGLVALGLGCLLATGDATWAALLLLGLGAASTVSPGLFLTGLGLRSDQLGRGFALVQLLRSIATYAVGPVALALVTRSSDQAGAVRTGLLVMAVVAGAALVVAILLPALSGARLRAPDLEAWLDGDQGLPSPATAVHLRPSTDDEDAEPLVPVRLRRGRSR